MNNRQAWRLLISTMLCIASLNMALAQSRLSITADSILSKQFLLEQFDTQLNLGEAGLSLTATAKQLNLAKPFGQLQDIIITCSAVDFSTDRIDCKKGRLQFQHAELGYQDLDFSVSTQPAKQQYQVVLDGLGLAGGQVDLELSSHQTKWVVKANANKANLIDLLSLVGPYLSEQQQTQLSHWQLDGVGDLVLSASGSRSEINTATIKAEFKQLAIADETGLVATDNVSTELLMQLTHKDSVWFYDGSILLESGEAYIDPVFASFDETPMNIGISGQFDKQQQLTSQIEINQHEVLQATLNYHGGLDGIGQLSLQTNQMALAGLYQYWLQPFLIDSALNEMELAGELTVKLAYQQDALQVFVELSEVYIDDLQSRFGLYGINGLLAWSTSNTAVNTDITWSGGYLYALPLGHSQFKAVSIDDQFTLSEQWLLPVLDGELQIKHFNFDRRQSDDVNWSFDAELTPISMQAISSTLSWPTMQGTLAGRIPKVSYQNHQIEVEGALTVNLFDGITTIRDLSLSDPFGALPQLNANLDVQQLDLETLTSAFDFGKITGKLDGYVHHLRMANWRPVAFDAKFYTPENDESKRRISQKAVNSLSEVSGGVSGALQKSLLRFFEDFSYKKIGISCQLNNEVCVMDGVKAAEQGYYIVEGGGLPPRIDVVGYTHRVNWPDLLQRLKAVTNSSGPIIQ